MGSYGIVHPPHPPGRLAKESDDAFKDKREVNAVWRTNEESRVALKERCGKVALKERCGCI